MLANTAYQFTGTVDLTGDRLVCGENTVIVGLSSENCRIKSNGSIGTIGFSSCLFNTASGQTAITLASSCVISRRFRIIYSSFVTVLGETSLNVSTSATIPVDGYILDTVNFSGGGDYVLGVQFSDNKASFIKCKGISNSRTIAHYFMNNNATTTVISATATPYKIFGTTTAGAVNQRFTHSNNRATYTGALTQTFDITAVITATSGNNQLLGFYITKNEIVIIDSESRVTTSGSGRSENVKCQTFVELSTDDYIEIVVENYTATTNVVATDLSVMIRPTL